MSTLAQVIIEGVFSAMPSPSIVGRLYFTTDTSQIYYDTGSAWDNVTPASSAIITAIQQQSYVYAADTGAANALVVSLTPTPTIAAGSLVVVKVANSNTGASTIAVNGGSAKAITKNGTTALTGGEMTGGQIVFLVYDGTEYQLIGGTGSGGGGGTVPSVTFSIATGAAASPAAPYVLAPVAGTVSNCYFTTLTSDGSTNLVFNLKKNGTSVLSGSSATVTAGTSAGTVSNFSLTSGSISVSQGDVWELDITGGTSNWTGTVQCY